MLLFGTADIVWEAFDKSGLDWKFAKLILSPTRRSCEGHVNVVVETPFTTFVIGTVCDVNGLFNGIYPCLYVFI